MDIDWGVATFKLFLGNFYRHFDGKTWDDAYFCKAIKLYIRAYLAYEKSFLSLF